MGSERRARQARRAARAGLTTEQRNGLDGEVTKATILTAQNSNLTKIVKAMKDDVEYAVELLKSIAMDAAYSEEVETFIRRFDPEWSSREPTQQSAQSPDTNNTSMSLAETTVVGELNNTNVEQGESQESHGALTSSTGLSASPVHNLR